jgi:uncharacterized protein YdeI (YjbR/CyaY-like superfamily)
MKAVTTNRDGYLDKIDALVLNDRNEWRKWLEKNSIKEKEVWLIHYKKHTGKLGISLEEAVEEAICFGWIDSKMKSLDDEKYILRYSPRKKNSPWSKINKERAKKLINQGKMTEEGLDKIKEARRTGKWSAAYSSKRKPTMPSELEEELKKDKTAWENFNNFANSYQTNYVYWVVRAKREETRKRRIKEVVKRANQNKKPGME